MWPILLLIPLVSFVGASFVKKAITPARIPDSNGQTQTFSVNAPADGSVSAADILLDRPFASPNGVAPTLPEWYDIVRGDPADFGYKDMFVGPESTPGGKLRDDVKPPNYVAPNVTVRDGPTAGVGGVRIAPVLGGAKPATPKPATPKPTTPKPTTPKPATPPRTAATVIPKVQTNFYRPGG